MSVEITDTGVMDFEQRLTEARMAVDYLTGVDPALHHSPVPNCPGWTVYNTAVHVGRVAVAWEEMMKSEPGDAQARDRAYEISGRRPSGADVADLAGWAHSAIDYIADNPRRECFFSMTGGHGTTELWAWHAASEIGVHRLDVEQALGHNHAISDRAALDSVDYACRFFLPAMRRVTGRNPGSLSAEVLADDGSPLGTVAIPSVVIEPDGDEPQEDGSLDTVSIRGPVVQVLLAVWGRPYHSVEVVDGSAQVLDRWRALPGQSFQFGTWE
jgi:uncharacterized protein (TIGR03083 family)